MTSPAQLEANRRNALKSTGPRTANGKARSAMNALTHGLRARQPLLLDEDPAEYDRLRDRLVDAYVPDGAAEELLVDEIVGLLWRLRRAERVEAALYTIGGAAPVLEALARSGAGDAAIGVAFSAHATSFATLSKYESSLASRLRRALVDLRKLQSSREDDGPALVVLESEA